MNEMEIPVCEKCGGELIVKCIGITPIATWYDFDQVESDKSTSDVYEFVACAFCGFEYPDIEIQ